MAIKLYGHPASLCTRRVLLVLAEKGIDYEFINVNFIAGEQKKPPYEEMMLFGQIPALEDGSLRLYGMHLLAGTRLCSHSSLAIIQLAAESRAIARYLSSKYRDQGNDLLPAVDDVQGWALFEKFASVKYSQVFDAALQVLYLKFFNRVTKLHAKLDVLDKILATQDYLGGAEFTVVDILYMPAMQMLRQAGQVCLRAACKHRFLVEESL
ncbi:Glutathione S-transferase [Fusarium oxysporum f. sp. cubense]|uniref:glutathione transferase n=1 Tax=Fusarium oxysporum f. sp. cubense TaxID=61366 RepID=A0A559KSH9_FUSOC|nr:Glutathione S-transferase [Fusarium oxysporum f. sp. cubense]